MSLFRKFSEKRKAKRQGPVSAIEEQQQQLADVKEVVEESQITDPNAKPQTPATTEDINTALHKDTLLSRNTKAYNPIGDIKPPPKETDGHMNTVTRHDVEQVFERFAQHIHTADSPLPNQSGDGSYLKRDEPSGLMADIKSLGFKDLNTVRRIMEQKASGQPQDDRQYLMEAIIQLASVLPDHSKNRAELTSLFLDELWNGLPHPPLSYLGDEYKYRSADGSRNSYTHPKLGAANTPYARSVNPVTVTPGAKPDPFLLFDSLLARHEFKENPNRVSSVFFNWASIVIHDLFQTDHKDPGISKTSSYLDLSVLYGDVQEDQDQMRTFRDGKIKPDCFAEERLLAFPPTAGVMLIMLNRWHNYVVEQLALINENGRFTKPSESLAEDRKAAAWKKYDEHLFQTGRLITCGLYINIILYDYLRTIVNLNRVNSTWTLDPRMEKPKTLGGVQTPRGIGNQVSAEFALCYRWHASIGQLDEAWMEDVYRDLFGTKPEEVDMEQMMTFLGKLDHTVPKDPMERPFAHLKRGSDGKFDDDDLATIMTNAVEQVSGAFGARMHPKSLRAVTVLGILQARSWNMCTFNEFRQFFGLKKFDTFEEMNPDPYIADQLRNLYEHPDFVELYPGIAIEETKSPLVPGVGICPNHTLARAILSDAVALVRGDRFYTIDYNAKNLTNWGFNEANYDLSINQGCVMYKLLLRGLPNHFKPDSIYVHYPMTVPDENAKIMKNLGRFYDFNWEKPARNKSCVSLSGYANTKYVLERPADFVTTWSDTLCHSIDKGEGKLDPDVDSVFHQKQREKIEGLLYREHWRNHVKHFYQYITQRLIAEKSCRIATVNQVDIVRDVNNLAHVYFASGLFALPIKTEENPKGIMTDHELWMATSALYTSIFLDTDPTRSYPLRYVSNKITNMLGNLVQTNVQNLTATGFAALFSDNSKRENHNALADYGIHTIRQLIETGMSAHDMASSLIVPAIITLVPEQSRAVLDFYLGEGKAHWPDIQQLAEVDNADSDEKLLRYVQEGVRLTRAFGTCRRAKVAHTFDEGGEQISVKAGDNVFCSFASTSRDPTIFTDPDLVKLDRPTDVYLHLGIGEHAFVGKDISEVALTAMLRTVAKLPSLRRATGPQGHLKKVPQLGGSYKYMTTRHDSYFDFPTTMKVQYDGQIPSAPEGVVEH